MKINVKIGNIIRAVVLGGLLVAAVSAAQAGVCTNPFFTTSDPNGGLGFDLNSDGVEDFYVHNHLWNAANYPGTQGTTEICNYNSWKHTAIANNNNGDGAVKTYPNVHRDYFSSPLLSSFPVLSSSFAATAWGTGIYNVAYDVWLNNYAYEIMIWTENHNQRPGGNIVASGLSFSGYTWDLWVSGTGYLAFAAPLDPATGRPNHRVIASGTLDIKAFLNYLVSTGRLPSNATMTQLDFGVEVVSTDGVPKVFNCTDFSITDTGSGTPPSITTQPANQSVTVGQTATFSVVASGTAPLSYQWRKNGANISGATSSSYTTPTTVASDNGSLFSVVVSNPYGSTTSANATLTVSGGSLPSPWQTSDIGAVGGTGSASYSSGTFTVTGSGADIQGTADEFRYVYQTANGDCEIKARVTGVGNTNPWAKGGVMIRETLAAGSRHAFMNVTPSSGVEFLWRAATDGTSSQSLSTGATPIWVRVVRTGNTFTGHTSANGTSWATIGTATITMSTSVHIGLAVTSHADGSLCTSTFDNVTMTGGTPPSITTQPANQTVTVGQTATFSVVATGSSPLSYKWRKSGANISGATSSSYTTPPTVAGDNGALFSVVVSNPFGNVTSANATLTVTGGGGGLPSPWQTADIGAVGAAGSASHGSGTFTVVGSGEDIQGTADEFRYVYQTATGNCEIKARVTGVGNTNPWAKAGVMIRETLTAGSKHAVMSVTPSSGVEFLHRTSTGGSSGQALNSGSAPLWIRVVRRNKNFTGYTSPDGVNWTSIGSININMSSSVYIGLSVTSHADGTLNTSTFDNVTATP